MVAAPPLLRCVPVRLVLFIVILMGFVNYSSAEWLVDTNSNYKKLGEILHSFPHFTFSDGLEDDVQFSTTNSYLQMIALLAVPFAVVAILVLIAGITAACFIGICRCRGRTSPGRRAVVKMLRTFLALAIIGLCGGGIWGSFEIHEAVPYVIDKADDSASLILDRAEVVYVDAIQVQQYIPNMQELVDLLNTGRSYESDLNDVSDPAKKIELTVFILTLVLYGLIVAVTVLSLFVGFLRFHRTLLGISFLGWVGLLIIWVVCGIYLAGSVSISDVCETHNQHLLNEVLSSGSLEGNIIQHYVLCNGSSILQEFENDALLLVSMANSSLQQAIASGNKTQIEYWSDVLNKSLVLYDDFMILENCTDTYNNVESAKEKTCTDFMLGSFIVMTSQFFIGVLGFFVWILGVEEWRLESVAASGDEEYVSLNDEDRTPLVEVRPLERQNRRSIFA